MSKDKTDIRMIYDASSSGLNDAVWVPWFQISTVKTYLRGVESESYVVDMDIGEFSSNFMLEDKLQPYARVDISPFFPNEGFRGTKFVREVWTRLVMDFKASFYLTTRFLIWTYHN